MASTGGCAGAADDDMAYLDTGDDLQSDDEGDVIALNSVKDSFGKQTYLLACEQLGITPVAQIFKYLEHEELHVSHYGIGDKGLRALAEALKENTTIRCLYLEDNSLTAEAGRVITDVLLRNPHIQLLDFAHNAVQAGGCEALARLFEPKASNLRHLRLRSNGLGNKECIQLCEGLQNNATLEVLDLAKNCIGDRGAVAIGRMLGENACLREVDLSWNAVRSKGGCAIAAGLTPNCAVKVLDLSWTGLQDAGVGAFGPCCESNQALEHLMLSGTNMTADGLAVLLQGVQANDALATLAFDHNQLKDRGMHLVLECLEKNAGIVYIRLDNTGSSDVLRLTIEMLLEARREG